MKSPRKSRSPSEAKSALLSLLSRAKFYHWTSKQVIEGFLALREQFRLPAYEWQYLRGYRDCQMDFWAQNCHEFRYEMPDGRLIPANWDGMSDADKEHVRRNTGAGNPDGPRSGYYWTGTDKPWFVGGQNKL